MFSIFKEENQEFFYSRLDQLVAYLSFQKPIWSFEFLNHYPNSLNAYDYELIGEISQLSPEDAYQLDCLQNTTNKIYSPKLKRTLEEISSLTEIPQFSKTKAVEFPIWTTQGVKEKKRHELDQLIPLVLEIHREKQIQKVLDLGGGKGHLASLLAHFYNFPVLSVDQDQSLQEPPFKNYIQLTPYPENHVNYLRHDFSKCNPLPNEKIDKSCMIGIHTCGNLADEMLHSAVQQNALQVINFGCCYLRMNPETFPFSRTLQSIPIQMNVESFHLANRGYENLSFQEFKTKLRVKQIRYTFALLLQTELGINDFRATGENPVQEYFRPFSEYALQKLKQLKIPHTMNEKFLNQFFESEPHQKEVRKMISCNLYRWQMGGCLELYILLDRLFYLQECGYHSTLCRVFDKRVSPRNIAVVSLKI